jgi:hypothetical protein
LRICSISRKIAGLIPDAVVEIHYWLNPSGHIVVTGSTVPVTEIITRGFLCG